MKNDDILANVNALHSAAGHALMVIGQPNNDAPTLEVANAAMRAAADALASLSEAVRRERPKRHGDFCVWCQGGPADGWRYHTLIEPDDVIMLVPVPRRPGEFIRVLNIVPGDEPWPDAVAYERVRAVEQIDGECIYYPVCPTQQKEHE